jgi:hypothetical protein
MTRLEKNAISTLSHNLHICTRLTEIWCKPVFTTPMMICYLEDASRRGVFFCVCLRFCMRYQENSIAPNSVQDYNLLRPFVTMHNLQVSEWRKKTPWFQQSSIQTIRFTSNRVRHPLRSHALEIFVSGIPKTQQRPSMIDLLPGTT